ncbi:MAG: hypothetical protein A2Y33_07650 [Spirochaetes bacterium GWF1_51_8]|nr:MAG: hypothetical protein A2Y33_07650 [Spirochaetes bacterium GWF1_51_8]
MKPSMTVLRKDILHAVTVSGTPVSVKDILGSLTAVPNLSTVYRALAFLESRGDIHSLTLFDGTRFFYSAERHGHFVVCSGCRKVMGFDECPASGIETDIEDRFDFRITGHVLCFTGVCSDCRGSMVERRSQ